MLKFLGRLGKGAATITGLASVVLGVVGQTDAAQAVVGVGDGVGQVLVGVGAIVGSFGVGRKAGVSAADELKAKDAARKARKLW
jgi:hypothetical protein